MLSKYSLRQRHLFKGRLYFKNVVMNLPNKVYLVPHSLSHNQTYFRAEADVIKKF